MRETILFHREFDAANPTHRIKLALGRERCLAMRLSWRDDDIEKQAGA